MTFLVNAIAEVIVLGMLGGIVGTLIVLRKRAFFTVALSHATFPGGVVASMLGFSVLAGSAAFAVILVLIMAGLSRIRGQGQQVASGVVLTFGFALGALLQSLDRSASIPVDALLIGSLLSVNQSDVIAALTVLLVAIGVFMLTGRALLYSSFDADGFQASGFRPWVFDLIALALIAATVVVTMPAVGAILGVALIVGPAVIARLLVHNIVWMVPVAAAIGILAGLLGLAASSVFSVAAGGSIGLVVAALFVMALLYTRLKDTLTKRRLRYDTRQAQYLAT